MRTYGIVTTGKAHLDLMEALRLMGLDEAACRSIGIDIYKVGMVWPLALHDAMDIREGQARDFGGRGEARHHREPVQGIFLRLSRPRSPSAWSASTTRARARLISWIGELSPRALANRCWRTGSIRCFRD